MKLGQDMYQLNNFNIPKHEGVNKWASGGRNQKNNKNCPEIKKILALTSSETNSDNAKENGATHNRLTLALT